MSRRLRAAALPVATLVVIVVGLVARLTGHPGPAHRFWMAGLVVCGMPVVWHTLRGVLRGHFAADIVATLAIVTAVALGNPLPGLIVVLMQTGGEALERYAEGRASAAVRELEAQAPRTAHRWSGDELEEISAEAIRTGDRLLVRPGELVPADAIVQEGRSHVDTKAITGEPLPRVAEPGTLLLSGMANQEGPLTVRATAPAGESQYARIVELVQSAQASKTPLQRLADRYAVWFTPLTLLVCGAAWLASRDPQRVLAVLVVATPCPLILAVPVAVIGGINRAARRQVVFRHGGALEQLGNVTTAVFDKTGTLTVGRPGVRTVHAHPPFEVPEVLRLAAALELRSSHVLARTVVDAANAVHATLPPATDVVEEPGRGIVGHADGRRVEIGSTAYFEQRDPALAARFRDMMARLEPHEGVARSCVAIDGVPAAILEFADRVRPEVPALLARLKAAGVSRTLLLTGDSAANATSVGAALGFDAAEGDLLPEDKVTHVRALTDRGERVVMLGDGTNDAPALSAASVGVALASGGGGVTAEAADVVLLADDPGRLADAVQISRETLHIARQSVWVGLGLSGLAMLVAAFGYIPPTVGALLQEGIDVAVIVNALRAAGGGDK
ncbi:MAG: heavy metal translocating P-type ATPase [Gemmatimonadales bacterium]|nr:heavy metal translocating P-type ATPase [Gemmatimonadales bacterium]